ncbi:glycine receptor subunit alpha-3-like [Babylonia areolata]|uniref:glycine receptor subunit alpha-3-like n=1 Tax=Babylonia areolata TaxID=304850 RepID=UPI003FD5C86D
MANSPWRRVFAVRVRPARDFHAFTPTEVTQHNKTKSVKSVLDRLFDSGRYDHTIRPLYDDGQSVKVEIDISLNTLGPVIEREMQITASFYLRQQWRDPRLAFSEVNHTILLNHKRLQTLWVPDLFFSQSKTEATHDVTVPNVLIRVHPDGTILYTQRLTVTFQCLMDLRKFPMDQQTCYIRLESYSHTTDDMYFLWSSQRKSIDTMENAHIPDFELNEITTHDCTATYPTGTFPCLEAKLKLQRQIGFYMIQTYIPCMLIVTLSWVSFWLDLNAIPARISVGLLTVLTITTQSSGVRSELPRVPYTKSIDVWMSVCLVFVFAAYMQYAFVTVLSRRHRKSRNASRSSDTYVSSSKTSSSETVTQDLATIYSRTLRNGSGASKSSNGQLPDRFSSLGSEGSLRMRRRRRSSASELEQEPRDLGRVVDKWSRLVFPLAFFAFNVGYWVYYTRSHD